MSDRCCRISPHIPHAQGDCRRIEWTSPQSTGRELVLAWTCACRARFFELIQSGGVCFIRRTTQKTPAAEVEESYRMSARKARKLWDALLTGEAR
ncbi:hypothetical protein FHS22_000159 [Planomonospora venezuelensis]|uniref:Uncharacterized protein n=1 Tax=Planomonospora venezuelensis TaxID=1999 RepID=A0A841CSY8_PLAVE|nr:hypothetical protein [Planomonospora venezuelensis]